MAVSSFLPRVSQAKDLFPVIRAELCAAASNHSLPAGLSLDLLPIVAEGMFGYEFLPNWVAKTYLTIGCNGRGQPLLRQSTYGAAPATALHIATVDGRTIPDRKPAASHRLRQHDAFHSDWTAAAEAAWAELATLFPQQPRYRIEVNDARQTWLDEALTAASARLAGCDPGIYFCGLPDESMHGFALAHASGGRGQLVFLHPGRWELWFQSPTIDVHEEWAVEPPSIGASGAWVCAGTTRRVAERRHANRRGEARLHSDRRRNDRRQSS